MLVKEKQFFCFVTPRMRSIIDNRCMEGEMKCVTFEWKFEKSISSCEVNSRGDHGGDEESGTSWGREKTMCHLSIYFSGDAGGYKDHEKEK